ncbi:MAG: hypothetical protein H0X37_05245 [Herpetosiphonaceae bacterium]|nr:hypothetical protein [Herpetosiphonaceae bacterium]
MVEQVALPELYCPFPSAINRGLEVVGQQTVEWARRFKLLEGPAAYERLDAMRIGLLTARAHPHTPLAELQLVTDWTTWLFILDDHCDELGIGKHPKQLQALHHRTLTILRGAAVTDQDNPMLHALHDLRERLLLKASAEWMRRFITNCQECLEASIWEATNRANGIIPDVTTYIKKRAFTGGMYPYVALFEITEDIQLPTAVTEDALVIHLTRSAINVVCWSNDILSLGKEMKMGDVHNLVLTLQHKYRLSLKEAIARAAALHDAEVRSFINMEQRLPSFGSVIDPELQRYLGMLRSWMRGNLDWSYTSYRYLLTPSIGSDA